MRILKSKTLVTVSAVLSLVALSPLAGGDDAPPVVPMGALAHATAALEKTTEGKVLEIRLANAAGAPSFEAALVRNDALVYMRIESPSSDVTEIKVSELPPWLVNYRLEAYTSSVAKAQVPLDEAIVMAEARELAPAIGAGIAKPLAGTNAVLAWFVETVKGSRRELLAVDAKSGAFLADPDALYEPPTPVQLARRMAQ